MIKIDEMELADIYSPAKLAAQIHAWNPDMPIPVPVYDIARACGIEEIVVEEVDGFEGLLLTNDTKSAAAICVSGRGRRVRQRFTVAHELGHFLIPTHEGAARCSNLDMLAASSGAGASAREKEANQFAAHLLLPQRRFQQALGSETPSLTQICELAARYDASIAATVKRAVNVSPFELAAVFSHNNTIRYCHAPRSFPLLRVQGGDALVGRAQRMPHELGPNEISAWDPAEQECWIEGAVNGDYTLYEQTIVQTEGYAVTLLMWERAGDAISDEEEDTLVGSRMVKYI